MPQAFTTPIADELHRLSMNYIIPLLALNEDEFRTRLRVANGPEGIANAFDIKAPKLDQGTIVGTKKSSDKKIDDYTQAQTKTVTHLLVNVKAIGNVSLLSCIPSSGRQPLVEITRDNKDLSFIIPYNEQTNDRAWEVLNSIQAVLDDIDQDMIKMLPEIRANMAKQAQQKIDDIDRDKAIDASISFPIRDS